MTDPADCPNEYKAQKAIAATGIAARKLIAKPGRPSCTDALVQGLAACADTVDGLINPAGNGGCLPVTHASSVDSAVGQEYGHVVSPDDLPLQLCQSAIASAGQSYATAHLKAIQSCRNQLNKGKPVFFDKLKTQPLTNPADCVSAYLTAQRILNAGEKARRQIADPAKPKCTDALLSGLGACAASVDALVDPAGTGGCLLSGHATQVGTAIAAEY